MGHKDLVNSIPESRQIGNCQAKSSLTSLWFIDCAIFPPHFGVLPLQKEASF